MRIHKDLDVWKEGIDFVTEVYKITSSFPKEEMYGNNIPNSTGCYFYTV